MFHEVEIKIILASSCQFTPSPTVILFCHSCHIHTSCHNISSCPFIAICHFLSIYFTAALIYITASYCIVASSSWHFEIITSRHFSTHLYLQPHHHRVSLNSKPAVTSLLIVTSLPGVKLSLAHTLISYELPNYFTARYNIISSSHTSLPAVILPVYTSSSLSVFILLRCQLSLSYTWLPSVIHFQLQLILHMLAICHFTSR
jgi:hypothetical protein